MIVRRFLLVLTFSLATAAIAVAQPEETLYLELWQPGTETPEVPAPETQAPETEAPVPTASPRMRLAVGRPTVSARIADWCVGVRAHGAPPLLPEALLRGAAYDRFATDSVPLLLEVLIDDVEMRYALGTERPDGASGTSFPFFELCAVGFGTRSQESWSLDVLHVANHRDDSMALGLYKGVLSAAERAYLDSRLGYPLDLPDPAGLLLVGSELEVDTLILVESSSSDEFDALRGQIMR